MAKPATYYIDKIKGYTKSADMRLQSMVQALLAVENEKIAGDIVECGVWRGGNIMLARLMAPSRTCWLYDTFDGMTVPDAELDTKRSGEKAIDRYNAKKAGGTKWDAVEFAEVMGGFMKLGLYDGEKLRPIIGPVEETCHKHFPDQIAILRLDVDWYLPTKVSLEQLYPRLVPGGFLIIDDYGHWMGCKKAVDDYFQFDFPTFTDADYSCRVFRK